MDIKYDNILNLLKKKFKIISKKEKNYFVNDKNEVVATYDDNSISMFFNFPKESRTLWDHEGFIVATFAKKFQVNDTIADIIILEGLYGACNDARIIDNCVYETYNNNELRDIFETNYDQEKFDKLPYEERIMILEKMTGAKLEGAKIDGIRLFGSGKEAKISSCGTIESSNGYASIEILNEMRIDGIKVNEKYDGFDLNILNIYGKNTDFDYNKCYRYWRQENDLYYTDGIYWGQENDLYYTDDRYDTDSLEVISFTERRKYSTVDEDSIFYIGNPYAHILNDIYYNSKSSLNSRRLQMKFLLSQIASAIDLNKSLKDYSFNKRKVDVYKSSHRTCK